MLDWTKIDNERLFQQMVNDLFALEIGKPGYLPSSPYIGPDGGWDGRFEKPYLDVSGMSQVQAKWTKHNLDDAYGPLRGELEEALGKASAAGVNNLYFATNAELRVGPDDHVGKLAELNKGRVDNLFIYHREGLRSLIEKSLWLRHKYFRLAQRPLFAPFTEYFTESEPDLFTEAELVGRMKEMGEVESFLTDNKKKVFLLHAPQGEGKSRFLFEVAKSIQGQTSPTWQSWFCRPSLRTVEDAVQDEIDYTKNNVLFLDNADMYEETTKKLLDVVNKTPGSKLKLVLSVRTPSKDMVQSWVSEKRIIEVSMSELEKLPEEALIDLLKKASIEKTFDHPERIVRALGHNPFFVIAYSRLMTGEATPAELKSQITNSLETGLNCLTVLDFTQEEARTLLTHMAAIVPFRLDYQQIVEQLSSVTHKTGEVLVRAVKKLIEVRLLRYVGSSIRFSSDLNGNVYLGTIFEGRNGTETANELFERWLPILPENIASNIASASRNCNPASGAEASSRIIHTLVHTAADTTNSQKNAVLNWIKHLTFLAPEEVSNLLFSYINEQKNPDEISRDTYGPVIQGLLHVPGFQEYGLRLTNLLSEKQINGTYINYEPTAFVKGACSPIETGSIDICIASMHVLCTWADSQKLSDKQAELITTGIKEALSGSHEYEGFYGHTITTGRRGLVYSAKLEEYRNAALEVYKKIIYKPEIFVQVRALGIYNEIGRESYQREGTLWNRIVADHATVLDWIIDLLASDTFAFPALAQAEDVLMRLWANNEVYPDLSTRAEELLAAIDRSVEFQVYKLMMGREFIISDFETLRTTAPVTGRWSWLVYNHMRRYRISDDDLSDLTGPLNEKYKTAKDILTYLAELDESIRGSRWNYTPLIESWGKHNPAPFAETLEDSALSAQIPERFKGGYMSVGATAIEHYIDDFAQTLIAQNTIVPLDIKRLIDLLIQNNVRPDIFIPWMKQIVPKLDEAGTRVIWDCSYFLFRDLQKQEQRLLLVMVDLALANGLTANQLDACDFLIHHIVGEQIAEGTELSRIKAEIISIIKDVGRLDHREEDIINCLFGDDIIELLDFVEYRLKQNQEKSSSYLDSIPYDGFKVITRMIKDPGDFQQLIDRLIAWNKANLISSYGIEALLKHVPDKETSLVQYIEEQVVTASEQGVRNAIVALYALDFGANTIDTYLKVFGASEKTGLFKEVRDVFVYDVLSGSCSVTIGEPPPALVSKRDNLIAMAVKCMPGQIKNLVQDLVKDIENSIQSNLKEAEEIMHPKE